MLWNHPMWVRFMMAMSRNKLFPINASPTITFIVEETVKQSQEIPEDLLTNKIYEN